MTGQTYVVMLTRRCNFRCEYCYQAHASVDLPPEVLERISAHIRSDPSRWERLVFHGGEPLLRKDLIQEGVSLLLDDDGERICDFGIVTNGSLLDEPTYALFAEHHFRVDLSFDGCREAQAGRDADSFDDTVANLRRLVELSQAGQIELRVGMTVTQHNLPYLAQSVEFLCDLDVPTIVIEGESFEPWIEGRERLIEEQVELVVQQMERRLADRLPIPISRLQPLPFIPPEAEQAIAEQHEERQLERLDKPECSCGTEKAAVVDADGTAWACPMFIPDLGRVTEDRLQSRDAFRLGQWDGSSVAPTLQTVREKARAIRSESIMAPKRERWSRFGKCSDCLVAADCTTCPAASHMPDAPKAAEEVHPLLCRLNMAFLSRRSRLRRPANLADIMRGMVTANTKNVSA